MKRPAIVVGGLFVGLALVCSSALSGAEEHQAAPASPAMAKAAVTKVLEAHSFTPPITVPGPQGTIWYIGSRSGAAHSVEQAVVGVHRGNSFSVELSAFKRDKAEEPWKEAAKANSPAVVNLEKSLRDQLQKELGMEERSAHTAPGAHPAAPAHSEKEKEK